MAQIQFIPGRLNPPHGPLARYRPVQPSQAVDTYVRRLTRPGDLVVDLFCQGPDVMRETVVAGRRALGFSVNPLLLAAARLGLSRPDAATLNAAFTRLADSLKGGVPLRHHMASLYRSACPACGAMGVAECFAWNRDADYPFEKTVRCPACKETKIGPTDDEDIESAQRSPSRGLAYYYALDRVAPLGHPGRERAAQLVELYTHRNLSALMDLTMRLEDMHTGENEHAVLALTGVLLDCFDAGSNLAPYDDERPRPRTLRIPSRYVERNVWLCFEDKLNRFLDGESAPPVPRAADTGALVRGETEGYALVNHAARAARETIPAESAAVIFCHPPQPDGIFWALSALWAGWLWDSAPAHALRPFLRRRRFDWDWHRRMLQAALQSAGPLLAPGGHLVTAFSGPDDALLTSTCLAACGAGYALESWGYSPGVGYRLVWRWAAPIANDKGQPQRSHRITKSEAKSLLQDLMVVAEEGVVSALRERGEPTERGLLHGSACAALAEYGLLARAAAISENKDDSRPSADAFTLVADVTDRVFETAPLVQFSDWGEAEQTVWWLEKPDRAADSLADRVGTLVWDLLDQRPAWNPEELVDAVYAHFPGPLTPDLALVLVCIESYSVPSEWPSQKVNGVPSEWPSQKVNGVPSEWPSQKVNDVPSEWPSQKVNGVQEAETLRLRPEDDPLQRTAELRSLRGDLAELGTRLGFEVRRRGSWDVRWLREGREAYVFDASVMVILGRHLLAERTVDEGAQRCLVIPGGRAALVRFKVQRDPRLARVVEQNGWQFVKFRHLRRLHTEKGLDRHALKTVLGLDPIVEQEAVQIPLF